MCVYEHIHLYTNSIQHFVKLTFLGDLLFVFKIAITCLGRISAVGSFSLI